MVLEHWTCDVWNQSCEQTIKWNSEVNESRGEISSQYYGDYTNFAFVNKAIETLN